MNYLLLTLRTKLMDVFLQMESDHEGQEILKKFGAKRFVKTTDNDYANFYKMAKEAGIDLMTYPYKRDDKDYR